MENRYLIDSVYGLNRWASIFMQVNEEDKIKANKMIDEIPENIEMTVNERNIRSEKPVRGEIYYCNFGTRVGSEIEKKRPCIVLQATEYNKRLPTALVIPITHKNASFATEFNITPDMIEYLEGNSTIEGCATALHVNGVSVARLGRKVGKLNELGLQSAFKALNEVIGTSPDVLANALLETGKDVALKAFFNELGVTKEKVEEFIDVIGTDMETLSKALLVTFGINKRMLANVLGEILELPGRNTEVA